MLAQKTMTTVIVALLISSSHAQPRQSQTLSSQQQAQVKNILSNYDAAFLTAADAQAIHTAFRDAGLRGGPELNSAVQSAGFNPEKLRQLDPPKHGQAGPNLQRDQSPERRGPEQRPQDHHGNTQRNTRGGPQQYSLEQAVSVNAQLHTIAFNGLAFLTGDFGASTFIPPGKVCDFFGFQYMRDIDTAGKGHNPIFLNRVAGNVLHILNDVQKQQFLDLAQEQAPQLEKLAQMRLPLIKAFHRQSDGQIPSSGNGLSKEAVTQYVGDIFAYDAQLSLRRAVVMAQVYRSLSNEQKAYLAQMKFGDFNTWPEMDERGQLKATRGQSKLVSVAYMTYASEFFSWTAGSVTADTYFCPERHGTYFGGFYMKDISAMGKRDFDISTSVTGDSGKAFISEVLTAQQRTQITAIPNRQRQLLQETIEVRKSLSQELRQLLTGQAPNERKILSLGRRYGELDGEMSWLYAMAFSQVKQTLTATQQAALMKLRNLNGYESAPYYLYSAPVKHQPELSNTDLFFNN